MRIRICSAAGNETHIDDERTKDTDATVGYVLEHREKEIQISPGIEERLAHLIPLPGIIADTLRVDGNSVDGDCLLTVREPTDSELRVWQSVCVEQARDEGNETKLR